MIAASSAEGSECASLMGRDAGVGSGFDTVLATNLTLDLAGVLLVAFGVALTSVPGSRFTGFFGPDRLVAGFVFASLGLNASMFSFSDASWTAEGAGCDGVSTIAEAFALVTR
jgi:hypothetical protein